MFFVVERCDHEFGIAVTVCVGKRRGFRVGDPFVAVFNEEIGVNAGGDWESTFPGFAVGLELEGKGGAVPVVECADERYRVSPRRCHMGERDTPWVQDLNYKRSVKNGSDQFELSNCAICYFGWPAPGEPILPPSTSEALTPVSLSI